MNREGPRRGAGWTLAVAWIAVGLPVASPKAHAGDASLPDVRVQRVRKAFDNGEHNAFTDLCRFQGRLYLTFRSCPDGHGIHETSSIVVLESEEGQRWKKVNQFAVENRDTRDPHFLAFKGRLFVYTGAWHAEHHTLSEHLGYAAWTEDGRSWEGPTLLEGTYGYYIWRAARHDGRAYLCGRRLRGFAPTAPRSARQSVMLVSDDGLVWKYKAMFKEQWGGETAFLFDRDGAVTAVVRRGGKKAALCRARPPYETWERARLGRYIGGPLLVRWNDRLLVGGRQRESGSARTVFYWLQDGELVQCAELPSGGDNSYPGFVARSDRKALVSYYSSHEKGTSIYLAELKLAE